MSSDMQSAAMVDMEQLSGVKEQDTISASPMQHRWGSILRMTLALSAMAAVACMLFAASDGVFVGHQAGPSRFLQADTTSAISDEMQAALDKHNEYRCMHGVPALTWDADIAASAQAWADNGVWAHSPKPRVINGEHIGENLAWGGPTRSALHATVAWYDEIQYTNPHGLATSGTGVGGEAIGHYTQIVWKSTSKIGCGKARMFFGSTEGDVIVCQYGVAGNWAGQFEENVLAPSVAPEVCAGDSDDDDDDQEETSTTATTTTTTTTTTLGCSYIAHVNTAVKYQGTGGNKLKRNDFSSETAYYTACQDVCNADAACGGFVDDHTDRRGRMCKPKKATSGYFKLSKIFFRKGSGC